MTLADLAFPRQDYSYALLDDFAKRELRRRILKAVALREVEANMSAAREMHAEADYARMWLGLYEQLVRYQEYTGGSSYPVVVHGRYLMSPSPIPRWDNPKLHQAAHLTLLSAGRQKRLSAVPPYTDVYPIEFDDVPFRVEDQDGHVCGLTGATQKFLTEIPLPDGSVRYEISDTDFGAKVSARERGESVTIGETYYDDKGDFYH